MMDWDGDGKIDPVDVGISIARKEGNSEYDQQKKHTGGGCLTSLLMSILVIICITVLIL